MDDIECVRSIEVTRVPVVESYDDAFWRLVRVAHSRAYRILGVAADAEDVASETLARAAVRWSRLTHPVDAWVSTVATRLAIDQQRKAWRNLPMTGDGDAIVAGGWLDGSGRVDASMRLDLARALAMLPRRQRQVLGLAFLSGFTEQEIGQMLGCSASTVQTHKQRGLARMRAVLDPDGSTDGRAEVIR